MKQYSCSIPSIIILIICIPASLCLGQNRYTQIRPTEFVETYDPYPFDEMYKVGAALQAREDQNRQYRSNLIDWIFKIKSNTNDKSLNAALTSYYNRLVAIVNLKHVSCGDQLDRIKFDIQAEIEKFNSRQQQLRMQEEELPIKLSRSANEKLNREDYIGAIEDYSKLLSIQPGWEAAYYYRAVSYYKLYKYSPAIADLDQFIQLTNHVSGYDLRASARYNTDDLIGALADYNKVVELNPDAIAYYNRGDVKRNLGDDRGAISDYDKSLALEPNNSNVYNNRGWSKYKLKRYSEAILDLDKSIELDPKYWVAYDSRADVKYAQNNIKGCIEDCLKTISINSKCSNSYLLLGKSYQKQGQLENACKQWSKAGELGQAQAYELIRQYCQ